MLAKALAVLASCIQLAAFAIYIHEIFAGRTHPSMASWTIGAFLTVLNLKTYFSMSGDWVKSLLPAVSSIATIATFFSILILRPAIHPDAIDKFLFLSGLVVLVIWWKSGSASIANISLQICSIVGMIPTFRVILRNPYAENQICWRMWALASLLMIIVVLLRGFKQRGELVSPAVCMVSNVSIAVTVFITPLGVIPSLR